MQKKKYSGTFQIKMPYIKYLKLYSGFESVPRKKDTFKKNKQSICFSTKYLRERGAQPRKCSHLEQTTREMGEPELIYQITSQLE